jgi:transposase
VDTNQEDYPVVTMEEEGSKKKKHSRGSRFTDDFRANAVSLVLDQGMSADAVAKDLGVTRSTFYRWLKQARIDRGEATPSSALTTDERRRLTELERENRQLKMERELLKKWVAFSAKELSK